MMESLKEIVRSCALALALIGLLGAGMVAGTMLVDYPASAVAQDDENRGEDETCEDDACVKNERWWWWDSEGCRNTEGTGSDCNVTDDGCGNYQCDDECDNDDCNR